MPLKKFVYQRESNQA